MHAVRVKEGQHVAQMTHGHGLWMCGRALQAQTEKECSKFVANRLDTDVGLMKDSLQQVLKFQTSLENFCRDPFSGLMSVTVGLLIVLLHAGKG